MKWVSFNKCSMGRFELWSLVQCRGRLLDESGAGLVHSDSAPVPAMSIAEVPHRGMNITNQRHQPVAEP